MNRRQFLKAATITTLYTAASPLTALAQGLFPFPLLEITDNPALVLRAGLSSLGGIKRLVQHGQKVLIYPTMRYLPHVTGHGRNPHPDIVRELIQQALSAGASQVRVMDSAFANPERCARRGNVKTLKEGLYAVACSLKIQLLVSVLLGRVHSACCFFAFCRVGAARYTKSAAYKYNILIFLNIYHIFCSLQVRKPSPRIKLSR